MPVEPEKTHEVRALECMASHQFCREPSTDSICKKEPGHGGQHHCAQCGLDFS